VEVPSIMSELHYPRQAPWDPISSGQDEGFHSAHRYRRDSDESIQYNQNGEEEQDYRQKYDEGRIYHQHNNRNTSVISDPGSQEGPRVVLPQRRMPIRRTSHLAQLEGERRQQGDSRSATMQSEHSQDDMPRVLYSHKRHGPTIVQSDPYGDTVPLWMPGLPTSPRQMMASKQFGKWDPDLRKQPAGSYDKKFPVPLMVPRLPLRNSANSKSQRSMGSGNSTSSGPKKTMHRIIEPKQSGFRRLVQRFDFKWYGVTMGTGIVSILLFTFSEIYEDSFNALRILSYVFFFMNLGIFGVIFLLTVLRYLMYPKLFIFLISDPGQSMYLGTFPMGFATIVTIIVNVAVKRLGGPTWPVVAWGLWWFDAIISVGVALGVPLGLYVCPPSLVSRIVRANDLLE
jgi:hypothetical protein